MARPKAGKFHCALCGDSFSRKIDYQQHILHHTETKEGWACAVCNWPFDDQLALENHQIISGHITATGYQCEDCPERPKFKTAGELASHKRFPSKCSDAFKKRLPHKENFVVAIPAPLNYDSRTYEPTSPVSAFHQLTTVHSLKGDPGPRSSAEDDSIFCYNCKKAFTSLGRYNNHFLGCAPSPPSITREQHSANGHKASEITQSIQAVSPVIPGDENVQPQTPLAVSYSEDVVTTPPSPLPFMRAQEKETLKTTATCVQQVHPAQSLAPSTQAIRQLTSKKHYSSASHAIESPTASNLQHQTPVAVHTNTRLGTPPQFRPQPAQHQPSSITASDIVEFGQLKCIVQNCERVFRSEAGLKTHQADAHNIGGQGLNLHGKDSWMLSQQVRNQLAQAGVIRTTAPVARPPSRKGRGILRGPSVTGKVAAQRNIIPKQSPTGNHRAPPSPSLQALPGTPTPSGTSIGSPEDMIQANEICGKILRLAVQSDVLIHNDGKMTCGGIDWTRVGVFKQAEVPGMFDSLCHLPKALQSQEYLPPPKTLKDEYQAQYPMAEFKHSPEPSGMKTALAVVAISCVKVLMSNGCQEAVKIAAVDVVSSRILMNNLVCTDPKVLVRDWRTNITGLTCFEDMEAARQDGYKIFKGWQAARAALWKFIDKQTIILGHNLRSDLDALRMIHGRAVDIAKLLEKAAEGPLSKQQLTLEALCRDAPQIRLFSHPSFGRDSMQNAFAARELALWKIKNEDGWKRWAKQKSLDYQRLVPSARA